MNTHFLCTEVVGRKLTQLFIRTKNDIGSNGNGTFIVDTILAPCFLTFMCLLCPGFYGIITVLTLPLLTHILLHLQCCMDKSFCYAVPTEQEAL